MEIDKINFNNIHESEYNPRKISRDDLNSLTKNLNEFGLVDPIIINLKNNKIIGGHQRYKVLKNKYKKENNTNAQMHLIRLGDIGWVFESDNLKIDDDAHEKALNLALNKISGEWDYDKLTPLMAELNNANFNMDLTGFDSLEIESFNIAPEMVQEFEEVEEIQEKGILVKEGGEKVIPHENGLEEGGGENSDNDEDVLVSSEDIEKQTKYTCPKCGYKW